MTARASANTHIGRRKRNEDSFYVADKSGLFVVADGVGGVAGGEVASDLVVRTMSDFFERRDEDGTPLPLNDTELTAVMAEAIYDADRSIIERRTGRLARMGSTVAAMLVREQDALVAHVGDSRVYRLRAGVLTCLTRDHNAANDTPAWAEAPTGPAANHQLTRAVGVPGYCNPEFRTLETQPGDRFLLCTDGLTGILGDCEIAAMLAEHAAENAANALVKAAVRFGADDNVTAIVVEIP